MRTIFTLLALSLALIGQQFDVVQLDVQHRGYGEPITVEVQGALRLEPNANEDYNSDWRNALVAQVGQVSGIRHLRISNTGASYQLDVRLRQRHSRLNGSYPLNAHEVSLVQFGSHGQMDRTSEPLLVFMADEKEPLTLPTVEDLFGRITGPLVQRNQERKGLARVLQKLKDAMPARQSLSGECVQFLSSLPLQQVLTPTRSTELLDSLRSDIEGIPAVQRSALRLALGDLTALDAEGAAHDMTVNSATPFMQISHVSFGPPDHMQSMRAGWSGSDDPVVRGAMGWALCDAFNMGRSMSDSRVGLVLHEEVVAGRAQLPGDAKLQVARRAFLDRLAAEADATPALIAFLVGTAVLVALLLGLRRLSGSMFH
ncbi:MAG: hypothetical protein EXS14_09050 [Planctomycetes bacterium]|nr:hypothetical protein [Planctomycetota bacterium]